MIFTQKKYLAANEKKKTRITEKSKWLIKAETASCLLPLQSSGTGSSAGELASKYQLFRQSLMTAPHPHPHPAHVKLLFLQNTSCWLWRNIFLSKHLSVRRCATLHACMEHRLLAGVCRRSKVNWMLALRYLPCKEKAFDVSADACLQFSLGFFFFLRPDNAAHCFCTLHFCYLTAIFTQMRVNC